MTSIYPILVIIVFVLEIIIVILISTRYWRKNYLCHVCYKKGIEKRITQNEYEKYDGGCKEHFKEHVLDEKVE